jgi:import inner membrane translocase subunit TIM50
MAQYYEIVLYSPSIDAVAEPVVNSLDKTGCIMHRLYRDATHYKNGIHIKDLNRLNRNVNKMIIIDDDPEEVAFNPDNLLRVKPYTDPTDFSDDTLEKITPFLVEIAREGYNDVPSILRQYKGMDADEIAEEHARRIEQFKFNRQQKAQRGLGGLARHDHLPPPELTPTPVGATHQLTSKDLVGAAPPPQAGGMVEWMHKRAKEKEEHQMRKMEKWNEVMLKKQQAKKEAQQKAQQNS